MGQRYYSEIHFHITWHVADNEPVLKDEVEAQAHRFLREEVAKTPHAVIHAVGGTDDHVHLVVSPPPTVKMSEWIGRLKGGCSYFINHEIVNRKLLDWQSGYGILTFGTRDLPWVIDYVRDQRKRHAERRTVDRLERIDPPEEVEGQGPTAGGSPVNRAEEEKGRENEGPGDPGPKARG